MTTEAKVTDDRLIARLPFYYGWVVLVIGALGLVMTSPGQTYTVSIFIEHFIADLGVSRSLVSTLYMIGTLTASAALPYIGRQIDRRGSRVVTSAIVLMLALTCFYFGTVRNWLMLLIGFIGIRLFGQGGLGLASGNVINQWWVRRRGMASGLSGLTVALLGIGGFPNLTQALIGRFGWRLSYPLLGLLVLTVMLPLSIIFLRNRPEQFGLLPDGAQQPKDLPESRIDIEVNWTRAEAMRTASFWVLALGGATIAMLSTGLFFHMVSIFGDSGLSPALAAAVYLPISLSTALVNTSSGFLSDRLPLRYLLALALLLQAAVLLLAPNLNTLSLATIYGIMLGALSGLFRTVNVVAWPNFFGRLHLGTITGTTTLILVAGTALGPLPFGIARDLLGSYDRVLAISSLLPFLLAIAALLFVHKPVLGHP